MKDKFLIMQTKTMKVIYDFIWPLMEHWTSDDTKQANKDRQGDSNAVLERIQDIKILISDIEALEDFARAQSSWQWPFCC
jgi:chitinase